MNFQKNVKCNLVRTVLSYCTFKIHKAHSIPSASILPSFISNIFTVTASSFQLRAVTGFLRRPCVLHPRALTSLQAFPRNLFKRIIAVSGCLFSDTSYRAFLKVCRDGGKKCCINSEIATVIRWGCIQSTSIITAENLIRCLCNRSICFLPVPEKDALEVCIESCQQTIFPSNISNYDTDESG